MTHSSLSLTSASSSEFYVLSEVDSSLRSGMSRLTEDSIAKLRSKIETQKRKVSDVLSQQSSSFISSKESEPFSYTSTRKVAKLTPHGAPSPSVTASADKTTCLEFPSRKIAPSNPSLAEEIRPKRIVGRTDPSLPVSHIKTKRLPVKPPVQEKPKQKLAKPEKQQTQATFITPYSWRRGQVLASQLLRPKSLSEGSLSSSALSTHGEDRLPENVPVNEYDVGDTKFRTILEDNGLTSFDRDSLNFEGETGLPDLPLTHLPLDIDYLSQHPQPPSVQLSPERPHSGLSQSAPNLKEEGLTRNTSERKTVRQLPPDPPAPPKVRHYDRENIQSYIHKQKETRKNKRRTDSEEKERMKEMKQDRLNDLYLKQKTKLQNNLMFAKAKELNIPRSFFSPISSETFIKKTPIDLVSISDSEPLQSELPLSDASLSPPSSPPLEAWTSEDRFKDPIIQTSPSQDVKTDFETKLPSPALSLLPDNYLTELTVDVPYSPTLSVPVIGEFDRSPSPLPPSSSTRIENIRLAALALREKLDQDYQKAGRELASVSQIPGTPSFNQSPLAAPLYSVDRPATRGQLREFNNELSNIQRELEEDRLGEEQNPEGVLAPIFLAKSDQERKPENKLRSPKKQPVIRSLSETDWKQRSDGDPLSAINIYSRRHNLTHSQPQLTAEKAETVATGVQTFSPDRDSLGVDTLSLREDTKDTEIRKMLHSRSRSVSKYPPSSERKKPSRRHRKSHLKETTPQQPEDRESGNTLLETQMKHELQLQDILENAERQLMQAEKLTSQLSSEERLSEYQTKINRQKEHYEEQIQLLVTRVEQESAKSREFRQLSPLTETAELELGEKLDEKVEDTSPDVNAAIPTDSQESQAQQERDKDHPPLDHLTQEINRAREEASRAVIEMAKNSIETDQKIFTSTPSVSSHILPAYPPDQISRLEAVSYSTIPPTYSEDFNSESVLSTQAVTEHSRSDSSQLHAEAETDYDRQERSHTTREPASDIPSSSLSPVKQPLLTAEDSLLSISDMSFAYTSETEQLQQEDKVFQMVLPSKSHRRHSNRCSPSKHSRHDTSTDSDPFLLSSPRSQNKTKDEDSFRLFLDRMVSSLIKIDRDRAKHQEKLLELTERAIEDRTKVQLKLLNTKKSAQKGADLKRPNVQKLRKEILTRHDREFEEVKRLKQESLYSTQEQDFMRKQHRLFKKLCQSSKHVNEKIDRMGSGHSFIMDELLSSPNQSSLDATSSLPDLSRTRIRPSSISTSRSQTARSLVDKTADDSFDRTLVESPIALGVSTGEVVHLSASLSNKSVSAQVISERDSSQPSLSRKKKSLSSEEVESSEGNTLKDTESIFTDTGDSSIKSPYKQSLSNKTDSYSEDRYLPSSPKQVSFTETYSEQTDVEKRVASLKQKLSQRKHTARQLDLELKRKQREELRTRELVLKKQLEAVDKKIHEAQQKLGQSFFEDSTSLHTPHTAESNQSPTDQEELVTPDLEQTPQCSSKQPSTYESAVSRIDSISEQLTASVHTTSHSEEEEEEGSNSVSTATGEETHIAPLSPEREAGQMSNLPLEVSLMSSQGSPEVASLHQVSRDTVLYSDTFLTSLGEGLSPPDEIQEQTSLSREVEHLTPLQSLREEREKISDSLSTIMNTQLLSEMELSELEEKKFEVGDEVIIRDSLQGTVRYTGPTSFAEGIWIGVELREPVGTSNGSLKGVNYFECAPNHGIFLKPKNLRKVSESKDSSCVLAADNSLQESIREETLSPPHLSLEPLLSIVSEVPPDRSITVFSETESAGTVGDEQLRWSLESGDVTERTPEQSPALTQYDDTVQHLLQVLVDDAIDTCVSARKKKDEANSLIDTTAPWINTLITQWTDESINIYLAIKSKRFPSRPHLQLSLGEEVRTPDQMSPVRSPSLSHPQPITSEMDRTSLVKIADSALVFYRDRLIKQRPLDIEQLQFSRRSDTILPIAFNNESSPTRQAHHQIFRHFLFDLSYQVISEIMTEPKNPQANLHPPRKQRSSFQHQKFTYKRPKLGHEVTFIADQVSELVGYHSEQKLDRFQGNPDDLVEHLLIKEMREEEPEWIDYSEHEYFVKLETSDSIFNSMLEDTLELARLIKRKRSR